MHLCFDDLEIRLYMIELVEHQLQRFSGMRGQFIKHSFEDLSSLLAKGVADSRTYLWWRECGF